MTKRVLIITYYWPPSGGPGVQRVLNFAKYLPKYGWDPIFLTVKKGEYPSKDESLVQEIPSLTLVFKTKTFEPFSLFKLLSGKKQTDNIGTYILAEKSPNLITRMSKWIRLNLFLPDARVGWKHFAVREGMKIIKSENIDLILTSSPPHSVQLIGQELSRKAGIPWVADFRDPWKEVVYNQNIQRSAFAERKDTRLEKSALNHASGIVSISKDILNLLSGKCSTPKETCLVYNGYDNKPGPIPHNEIPVITYTGVLSVTRIPYPLIKALGKLKQENIRFKLKFIGNTCPELQELLEEQGLSGDAEYISYLPHHESIQQINASDILLLVIDDVPNNTGILTGKLFEYIGAQRPIFAVGNLNGEANEILQECQCGEMVDYQDVSGAEQIIRKLHKAWQAQESPYSFNNSTKYSRIETSRTLARFMASILSAHLEKTKR